MIIAARFSSTAPSFIIRLTLITWVTIAPGSILLCVKGGEKTVPRKDTQQKQQEQEEQEEQEGQEGQEGRRRRARARAKATRVVVAVVVDSLEELGSGGGKNSEVEKKQQLDMP